MTSPAEFSEPEVERLTGAAGLLLEAAQRLPVLRTLNWDRSYAEAFFASGEREPPQPEYEKIDPDPSLERIFAARALVSGASPVHVWLKRVADIAEETAAMLDCVGTALFHGHSRALYGSPSAPIASGSTTALDLAWRLDGLLGEFNDAALHLEPPETLSAEDVKARFDAALPEYFGAHAPEVIVTPNVSAKAAAGPDYIKLRADAAFSDLDLDQLLQHEALVHIATGMNGRAQTRFPILGENHPGATRTQEGLAVFAEFISGALDPRRFKRLADRTIAIDMAAEGADFLELYGFFRERNAQDKPFEAFESARRVVRGGLVNGGGPFTKDSVYLGGLIEVHHHLRAVVRAGDANFARRLFVGKIDLADLPAMDALLADGLIDPPTHLPPWARDARFLLSHLAYSSFLNEIDAPASAA